MGIRVHKVIGYGLKETTPDMFYDQGAFMMEYSRNQLDTHNESAENIYTKEGFITYLRNHIKVPFLHIRRLETVRWNFYDFFKYDHENDNSPLVIIPPGNKDWHRYNNSIDHVEETYCYDQKNRLIELQQGIYPYSSLHQNQFGKQLDPRVSCAWWREQNNILDQDKYPMKQEHIQHIISIQHGLSKLLGFKDYFDAKDNIAPWVPDIVRAFCNYTNLFVDTDTITKLRPMMWVYWA